MSQKVVIFPTVRVFCEVGRKGKTFVFLQDIPTPPTEYQKKCVLHQLLHLDDSGDSNDARTDRGFFHASTSLDT